MSNEEKKLKRTWGQSQAEYLAALQGRQVTVTLMDGKALKGELTGVDTYELFVRQATMPPSGGRREQERREPSHPTLAGRQGRIPGDCRLADLRFRHRRTPPCNVN